MNEIKGSDYKDMYLNLGIDTGDLGCVMLDTEKIVVSDVINDDDYFYSDEHKYINGNVSEEVPHVTVLYGLLNSTKALSKHISTVLDGWKITNLSVKEIGFFYGYQTEYIVIVALIDTSDALLEGHQRLSLLPHINTFGEYQPHVTLAYVKPTAPWEGYVKELNKKYKGKNLQITGINLGD